MAEDVIRLFMRHTPLMRTSVSPYHRHRFPAEIISHCVWLYFRFALSFRDVDEPTPREFNVSNPLTPSKVELMRQEEKAPVKNKLQGYRRLNRAKAVASRNNSVETAA
jgi:hypothetical protein